MKYSNVLNFVVFRKTDSNLALSTQVVNFIHLGMWHAYSVSQVVYPWNQRWQYYFGRNSETIIYVYINQISKPKVCKNNVTFTNRTILGTYLV